MILQPAIVVPYTTYYICAYGKAGLIPASGFHPGKALPIKFAPMGNTIHNPDKKFVIRLK